MTKPKRITKLVEKKESQEISLPKIINSEVNLLVFPFFALDRKSLKTKTKTMYRDIVTKGDQKIEILWQVTSNSEYGYPGLFDRKVHKAIEQIISEILRKNGRVKNPLPLGSLYNLFKKIDIDTGGAQYKKIKEAFKRITTTSIESKGTFYSKRRKEWIEDIFHLYERVVFKGQELPNGEIADTNYLFLGSWYLQNLNSFYIKPIDYNYLQSLNSKIASRLYEILGVKFYGLRNKRENFICYRYSKLCQLLPITPQRYLSDAKRQLNPAYKELQYTGFLSKDPYWDENTGKDWHIYYWPGERARKEMRKVKTNFFKASLIEEEALSGPKETRVLTKSQQIDLVNRLMALNVSKATAKNLVKHKSQQAIKKWIKAIYYTNAKDKAAYLVKAIKGNWLLPEEYLKEEEREKQRKKQEKIRLAKKRKEKEEQKKRKEEAKRLDRIYNSLDPLKRKEVKKEIEKRLSSFIRHQLEKELRKDEVSKLTKAALEEKRREVVRDWLEEGKVKKGIL